MNRLTLNLVAIATCILSDGYASGQSPQGSNCNQGNCQSDGIYQPTQWNNCQSCNNGRGHRAANPCREPRGSRCTSFWTRPLCPNGCVAKCCATKAFPDAGWNPPTHMPVNYDGAWYGSYLPQHAYGTPGGGFIANYPTVYQPTDTTQLGYYYNKVPTWQSRSDMIPGVPYPGNFHARVCPQGGAGCHGYHGSTYGPVNYGPVPASCENCNTAHYSAMPAQYSTAQYSAAQASPPQSSSPSSQQVVRPARPQRQPLISGSRLASMMEVFD